MGLNIALIYGSVREERQGIKAARYLLRMFKERNHNVSFIDSLIYALPLLNYMYKEYKTVEAPENMKKISAMLEAANAFVVVTGEYNNSIPPALKNTLDHFQKEYLFKPSAIASYSSGNFGGVRAAVQMRIILGELGTPSISTILPFPKVEELFDDNGNIKNKNLLSYTDQFSNELEFYANALKIQREQGVPF